MSNKRNQVEEEIARILDQNCQGLPSELRTRIKRLHELDRSMSRKLRSRKPEEANFAFFSEKAPPAPEQIFPSRNVSRRGHINNADGLNERGRGTAASRRTGFF